jgi:hypothetical protein
MLMRWSKSNVVLFLFLGENAGLSCLVWRKPRSISTDPVGFTSMLLLPKSTQKT